MPTPTTKTCLLRHNFRALIGPRSCCYNGEAEASRVWKWLQQQWHEGVVGLTRWFEKMESVFSISNCTAASQVKFATCTLQDDALTWWNSHVKTTTPEAAHAMPWATLKKMMTDKYCPRGEIKKIETEMWNLKSGDKLCIKFRLERGVRLANWGKLNPAIPLDELHLDDKLHFVEEPVEIVGREVKRLKRSRIPLVKVASDDLRDALSVIFGLSELKEINSVMSNLDESGVTYMEVSSPFEGLSDIGSPRADDHEYLELPWMLEDLYVEAALQAPPSLDYVPGLEEPEQAPPSPDYVPGPEHVDDDIVVEDQPYAEDASPTAQSPDYVPESDPKADLEEDDDEDPEEDLVDYPADGGDDGDDEEGSSEDDEDDDMDIEADDDDEEEEHPAPADSVVVSLLAADQAPSVEETEPVKTNESAATPPPHPAYRVTATISIPAPVPTPVWSDAEVARLLAISSPPSSPLSPWSSPLP
ncbi:transposon ty3-G gag-pol polyprotein [Tanacetum coccineum]